MIDSYYEISKTLTDEILGFVIDLTRESDRALVILGVARLDVGLENLLKSIMKWNPEKDDNLFGADRILGSFSAKITLAYRLGLIDQDFEHALQMIRKVRNEYAHSVERVVITDSRCENRIQEIVNRAEGNKLWGLMYNRLKKEVGPKFEAVKVEVEFYVSIATMIATLEIASRINEPINTKHPASFNWTSN